MAPFTYPGVLGKRPGACVRWGIDKSNFSKHSCWSQMKEAEPGALPLESNAVKKSWGK